MSELPPPNSLLDYNSLNEPLYYNFSQDKDDLLSEMMYFLYNVYTNDKINNPPEDYVPYAWGLEVGVATYDQAGEIIIDYQPLLGLIPSLTNILPAQIISRINSYFQRAWNLIDEAEEGIVEYVNIMLYVQFNIEDGSFTFSIIYSGDDETDVVERIPSTLQDATDFLELLIDEYRSDIFDNTTMSHGVVEHQYAPPQSGMMLPASNLPDLNDHLPPLA